MQNAVLYIVSHLQTTKAVTLLHSEWPKLQRVLAVLSAKGLSRLQRWTDYHETCWLETVCINLQKSERTDREL